MSEPRVLPHLDHVDVCVCSTYTYIKPALARHAPFFEFFSINLLPRSEQEWEGIATARGVAETDRYIAQTEKKAFKPITINTKFTCKLRDYLEEVEGRSFSDVEAKPHRGWED